MCSFVCLRKKDVQRGHIRRCSTCRRKIPYTEKREMREKTEEEKRVGLASVIEKETVQDREGTV